MLTDTHLYEYLEHGSEKGRGLFYKYFQRRVTQTAFRITNSLEDAEEITQDVFVEVFTKYASFKRQASLSTLIFRITTNKALDKLKYYKRKKRFSTIASLFKGDEPLQIPDTKQYANPEAAFEKVELQKILFKAMDQLSDKQRVAYTLCEMEDLSYKEISEIMELSIGAVESLIFKAKKKLREVLGEFYHKEYGSKQVSSTNVV